MKAKIKGLSTAVEVTAIHLLSNNEFGNVAVDYFNHRMAPRRAIVDKLSDIELVEEENQFADVSNKAEHIAVVSEAEHIADTSKMIDREQRRWEAALAITSGLLANNSYLEDVNKYIDGLFGKMGATVDDANKTLAKTVVETAIKCADELIRRTEGGEK